MPGLPHAGALLSRRPMIRMIRPDLSRPPRQPGYRKMHLETKTKAISSVLLGVNSNLWSTAGRNRADFAPNLPLKAAVHSCASPTGTHRPSVITALKDPVTVQDNNLYQVRSVKTIFFPEVYVHGIIVLIISGKASRF